ncbi:MAG: hypothetical protein KZQ56_11920 [gamma proteobacterium symbiont of Lucinoma myriamae]|nr:hypothetical protein [gamma proteobacterium symbiont of Lucinoma myriamae]MCU7833265.1 hypothetical protein [gamma proteobacterium symbiont of Lucinoma myriamae]
MLERLIIKESSQTSAKNAASVDSSTDFLKYLKLDQLNIEIDLATSPVKLNIDLTQLDLPPPYKIIKNLNITCPDFLIEDSTIRCENGHITFKGLLTTALIRTPFSLTYNVLTSDLKFNLDSINIGQGTIALQAQIKEQKWQSNIIVSKVKFAYIKPYLHYYFFKNTAINPELLDNSSALLSFRASASGILGSPVNNDTSWVQSAQLSGHLQEVQYQYDENMADKLSLQITAKLKQNSKKLSPMIPSDVYQLSFDIDKVKGEVFQNEIYIVPNGQEKMTAQFTYNLTNHSINFAKFNMASKNIFKFKSSGIMSLNKISTLKKLDAQISFTDLDKFNQLYLTNLRSG